MFIKNLLLNNRPQWRSWCWCFKFGLNTSAQLCTSKCHGFIIWLFLECPDWLQSFQDRSSYWSGLSLNPKINNELRKSIASKSLSLLDLRNYLFARQCVLLLKVHKPWEVITFKLYWSTSPTQTRPVVIIVFARGVRPYVHFHLSKSSETKQIFTAGRAVGWPGGSLTTPVLYVINFSVWNLMNISTQIELWRTIRLNFVSFFVKLLLYEFLLLPVCFLVSFPCTIRQDLTQHCNEFVRNTKVLP